MKTAPSSAWKNNTPDAEEIQEQERPSLGRILLREVQEMHKRKAEEEARLKAEEAAKAAQQSFSFHIDQNPRSSSRHLSIRTKPSLHAKKPPEQGSPTQPIHWPISPSKSPTSPLAERLCPALTGLVPSKIRCLCAVGPERPDPPLLTFVNRPSAKSREDCFVRTRQVSFHLRVGD